jgi:LAO/AO transport system kinase
MEHPSHKEQDKIISQIKQGDRVSLARLITGLESRNQKKQLAARAILEDLIPYTGNSIRIAISGAPGVGKSTLIEQIGMVYIEAGHKVAVLAIDPTSSISKGSILGDKTRMESLSVHPSAFIRPSASGTMLGGVARNTREAIYACEATGYDVIIIETVGVGQSETMAKSMSDCFVLMVSPGGGDELQGIKRGIVELADIIVINKADGDMENQAGLTFSQYREAMHYYAEKDKVCQQQIFKVSALKSIGILELMNAIDKCIISSKSNGSFDVTRNAQKSQWFEDTLNSNIQQWFASIPGARQLQDNMIHDIQAGKISPFTAADQIIRFLENQGTDS